MIDFSTIKVQLDDILQIEQDGGDFTACYDHIKVGSLELYDYEGDGDEWLWNIEVNTNYQRRGIGLYLLNYAVNNYERFYISSASERDHKMHDEWDTRFLTDEGRALIESALRNNIIKKESIVDPFESEKVLPSDEPNEDY